MTRDAPRILGSERYVEQDFDLISTGNRTRHLEDEYWTEDIDPAQRQQYSLLDAFLTSDDVFLWSDVTTSGGWRGYAVNLKLPPELEETGANGGPSQIFTEPDTLPQRTARFQGTFSDASIRVSFRSPADTLVFRLEVTPQNVGWVQVTDTAGPGKGEKR